MSHFQQHPAFFNRPIKLTEEEKKAPIRVIIDFFTDYNLSEVREIHQSIDHVCLTSDAPPFDNPEERDCLLAFRESEEKVLEAALILMETQPDASSPTRQHESREDQDSSATDALDANDVQNRVRQLQDQLLDLHNDLMTACGKGFKLRFPKK